MIPKIIHQIWIGPNRRPDIWMDTFRIDFMKSHPDWKYVLWTEKELDELVMINRDIYDKAIEIAGRADIARYEILNQFGGVYVDADIVWLNGSNFDTLLEKSSESNFFIANEEMNMSWIKAQIENTHHYSLKDNDKFASVSLIGSSPHHTIIEDLIKYISDTFFTFTRTFRTWITTGPMPLTVVMSRHDPSHYTMFDSEMFYPIRWHGINDIQHHRKIDISKECYCFQYGYSTNNLSGKIDEYYSQL